jgi:hypothetical protein
MIILIVLWSLLIIFLFIFLYKRNSFYKFKKYLNLITINCNFLKNYTPEYAWVKGKVFKQKEDYYFMSEAFDWDDNLRGFIGKLTLKTIKYKPLILKDCDFITKEWITSNYIGFDKMKLLSSFLRNLTE